MLTVLAAEKEGGLFSPPLRKSRAEAADIYYVKKPSAAKRLRKMGISRAALAPSAKELFPEARPLPAEWERFLPLLPKALQKRAALPLDELFISSRPDLAAEIVELCADCARLFTVISAQELDSDVFDRLYFNKGLIMRRVSAPGSRVGRRALCVSDGGRPPLGVENVELAKLGRAVVSGGPLDSLAEIGLTPTAALYDFAGLPLPEGGVTAQTGDEIFCLDIGGIL